MRLPRCVGWLSVVCSLVCASASLSGQQAAKPDDASRYPCRSVHTFDFWVGDFDATPWNDPSHSAPVRGHLHNTREYEGCVILERWDGTNGFKGMSMAFYDVHRRVWRMVWNGEDNQSNDFEGTYKDDSMQFEGWVLDDAGKRLLARNVLQNVSADTIRHVYSTSADGGKTWQVKSDGRFSRQKGQP